MKKGLPILVPLLAFCLFVVAQCNFFLPKRIITKDVIPELNFSIATTGGTIQITNSTSPIFGMKLVFPAGAVPSGESLNLAIDYQDSLPGPVGDHIKQVSKTIDVKAEGVSSLDIPITFTIPFDLTKASPSDTLSAFYWDADNNAYRAIGWVKVDAVKGLISFDTQHLSTYVILAVSDLSDLLIDPATQQEDFDTGFRPDQDGFYHPNTPPGFCLGMANYSAWYYMVKKGSTGIGLYQKYREWDPIEYRDDATACEVISRSDSWFAQIYATLSSLVSLSSGVFRDDETAFLLLSNILITHAPQTLLLFGTDGGQPLLHAVTVYKYDLSKKQFKIYDNNLSIEVTLDWDLSGGFRNYSRAYDLIAGYATAPGAWVFPNERYQHLYDQAEEGFTDPLVTRISIDSPALDNNRSFSFDNSSDLIIKGIATGSKKKKSSVLYYSVSDTTCGGSVAIQDNGTFQFTIPKTYLKSYSNEIQLFALNDTSIGPTIYDGFMIIHAIKGGNTSPQLSNGTVSPSSGYTTTQFIYSVSYYDADGDSPTVNFVNIDGINYNMTLSTGLVENGTYTFVTNLQTGSHTYSFHFGDGVQEVWLPSTGEYNGPSVQSSTIELSNDDGTCESSTAWSGACPYGGNLGDGLIGYRKFLVSPSYPFKVTKVRIRFVYKSDFSRGFYLHIKDETGDDLLPTPFLIPASEVITGWWEKDLSNFEIVIASGSIEVSLFEGYLPANCPPNVDWSINGWGMSLDKNSSGNSFQKAPSGSSILLNGELMIRLVGEL